ncbi:MAG TPA: diguanylate cyclase [Anaerolineales bacterium]|nr:diguanylate cyclase [Anaerolineales bacterium]
MKLEFTPYVLPFVTSTAILVYLSLYAFRLRRHVEMAGLFSMVAFSLAIWTACYALELSSVSLESKIFWAKMKYFGGAPGPVLWFVLSLHYTNYRNWLTTPVKLILLMWVILTIGVVFTNEFHRWYWAEIFLIPGFPETQSEHGFYFWVYAAGLYLLVLISVINYINYYRTAPILFRRQALLMVLGGFVPLGIRILEDFVGWDPFPKIDNVILFLLLSAVLFAIALFRFSALDIVPIAHNLIVDYINSGILVSDALGRVVEINPFARTLIGPQIENAIGKPLDELLKDWPKIDYSPEMRERQEQEISLEKNGDTLFFIVQVSPIRNERQEFIGHVIVLVDITDRKMAEMELERLARTDVLTDVINRRHFFELAEIEFERYKRYGHPLAIMMLDIDHFKQINDNHGHLAGDFVLKSIATECNKHLRTTDIFARYGGEEFICLLYEVSPKAAHETAERIREFIETTSLEFDGKSIHVTASFGLAFAQSDQTLEQVIDLADQCLYKSKTDGRNRVRIWQS